MNVNPEVDENLQINMKKIIISLRKIVLSIAPQSKEEINWGGLVFFHYRAFCGIMGYNKYISIVFDKGVEMSDPEWLP